MGQRQEYCIAAVIGGQLHRSWNPRSADAVSFGRALAKATNVEGVIVLGAYDGQTRFSAGVDISDRL